LRRKVGGEEIPWSKEFNLHINKCPSKSDNTNAGVPAPTISSKLAGVKLITLLAVTPFNTDRRQTMKDTVYVKERIVVPKIEGK
jgi:hypothetical protein